MTTQYDGRKFYEDTEQWYAGAIQCNDVWAYIEIKGLSPDDAKHALSKLIREGVKINYVELI